MKIAFVGQKGIPSWDGGVERYVESLSINLASLGQDVFVYNRTNYLPDRLHEFRGVKIINTPYLRGKNVANITHSFLSLVHALWQGVDIIHIQGVGPSLLAWLPKFFHSKAKIVATLHSFDYYNDKWGRFAKFMLKTGEKIMCRFSDTVIVLTESTKKYVKETYGRESALIPNGADLYDDGAEDKIIPWGLTRGNYIISVSRIIKLKGLQYLIPAFLQVKTDKKLVITGDGDYLPELEKLANGDPRIIFTGNQRGRVLDQLYANSYLFVQPSEMEGLSIALLEAMAHKSACLVSDIEANREAIGEAGFTFASKNIDDLKNKLQNLVDNPSEVDIKANAAYERAKAMFTWSDVARQVLEAYSK